MMAATTKSSKNTAFIIFISVFVKWAFSDCYIKTAANNFQVFRTLVTVPTKRRT